MITTYKNMKPLLLGVMMMIFVHESIAHAPLRLAIAGLSHGHVDWIFNRKEKHDVRLVGIYETNPVLIERYAQRYDIDTALFFTNLEEMLDGVKPEAVSAFGAISDHVEVVGAFAPPKIGIAWWRERRGQDG